MKGRGGGEWGFYSFKEYLCQPSHPNLKCFLVNPLPFPLERTTEFGTKKIEFIRILLECAMEIWMT